MYQETGIARVSDILNIIGDSVKLEVDTICYQFWLASELEHDAVAQATKNDSDTNTITGLEDVLSKAQKLR